MPTFNESPARLPGWTFLKNPETKSVRYRSPDGSNVGPYSYRACLKYYEKTGIVPQGPLGGNRSSSYERQTKSTLSTEVPIANSDETLVLELPDVKPTPANRSKSGTFTAREFAEGFQTIFVILTSFIAVAISLPEAQMTEPEVKAISIPLANIVERSKYNKTIGAVIVDKSDWMTLGYALYVYTDRVASAAREKRYATNQSIRNAQPPAQSASRGEPAHNGAGAVPGVSLRLSPTGLRGYTGNA